MSTTTHERKWFEIEKKVPLALIFGFVLQTGGALFWASAAERIARVEHAADENSRVIERVVRLEEQVTAMHELLGRIETKIDRLEGAPPRP